MSSNSKICPQCQLNNAAVNLVCLRCENSLIHTDFAPNWSEKFTGQSDERHYFLEEIFTPTLIVCIPLGLICAYLAFSTFGTFLMPIFFAMAILLAGTSFFPGDPVGDYLRRRTEPMALQSDNLPALEPKVEILPNQYAYRSYARTLAEQGLEAADTPKTSLPEATESESEP